MRIWVIGLMYTLAFIAGLATLWAFAALGVMELLEGRIDSMFLVLMIPIMAAMCVFSLIYGPASGRALKWRYWLFTTLAMALLAVAVPRIVMAGYVTALEGFVAAVLLTFIGGFLACLWRDAATGARGTEL